MFGLLKLLLRFSLRLFYLLLGIGVIWAFYLYVYGNFHQVDQNYYRSAQLNALNMDYYLSHYKIKTVLNLRGQNPDQGWYRREVNYCKEHNITHIDFAMGSKEYMTMQRMERLLHLIKHAKKPILVHCQAGADRTSLATALYLFDQNKSDEAYDAISIRYGHFPWLGSGTVAMDKSFDRYVKETRRESKHR